MEDKQKIKILGEALKKASEHLDYCGYGDSWERECAGDLSEEMDRAIKIFEDN